MAIDERWDLVSPADRCAIVDKYPVLGHMGMQFYEAVDEEEWDRAIELHELIQKHHINQASLKARISKTD